MPLRLFLLLCLELSPGLRIYSECFLIDLLGDGMKMSKNSSTLRETEDSVKGCLWMHSQDFYQVFSYFFQSKYVVINIRLELEPRFKASTTSLRKEMLKGRDWVIGTVERCINQSKIHDFMENLPEMAHLVSHYFGVSVVAMQTQNFKFPSLFLFLAHLAGVLS